MNTTGKSLVLQVTEPLIVLDMWLINTVTLKLQEFPTEVGLDYAILSHRWGDDEVLFKDLNGSKDLNLLQNKQGFSKVKQCCEQASRDKYSWAWVDTCCINKSSSAELSEAINSIFHWYRESSICYAYLSDVDSLDDIGGSEWLNRDWTLQELLALTHMQFFGRDWTFLSDKQSLRNELGAITSIPEKALYVQERRGLRGEELSKRGGVGSIARDYLTWYHQ